MRRCDFSLDVMLLGNITTNISICSCAINNFKFIK